MVKPQCAICQCYVTSGRCFICWHCREEFELGSAWSELPEWVRYLVREERKRRRERAIIETDFSELCYGDRQRIMVDMGEQDGGEENY